MDLRLMTVTCGAAAMLALPASASAATEVFGGTTGNAAQIAMDVKVSKQGVVKKITQIRADKVSLDCEQSGHLDMVGHATLPITIKIVDGAFNFQRTDTYGNESVIEGRVKGNKQNKIKGTFTYAQHYPAEGSYPEENCTTGEQTFSVKKGGPDVTPPTTKLMR